MQRSQFLRGITGTGLLLSAVPLSASPLPVKPVEQLDKALVEEFVRQAHSDMDVVASMLAEHPTLLNAAHDWEKGDFETGLGAASHVGYKELASFFLEKGAQANIFTACLFGQTALVKSMLTAFPQALNAKGPHGYTLLHHAEQGGDAAAEVKEYLQSMGAKDMIIKLF
jgi:ankyrin repeat protein